MLRLVSLEKLFACFVKCERDCCEGNGQKQPSGGVL